MTTSSRNMPSADKTAPGWNDAMAIERLRTCVKGITDAFDSGNHREPALVARCRDLLRDLISTDDWLPDELAKPHPTYYQQYLLYCDSQERFSLVSFVWGPGQSTPVHNHTVWGLVGVLRGAEFSQSYARRDGRLVLAGPEERLAVGAVGAVSPADGTDIHRVRNAFPDKTSISIHLYGGNIGAVRRHVFDPETGAQKTFFSGYVNAMVPNLWFGPR